MQYSLDHYGFDHDDILVLIDSDCFLVRPLSIRKYMEGWDIVSSRRTIRGTDMHYFWIGLVFLDIRTMPNKRTINFNSGRVLGLPADSAGQTHLYMIENPDAKIKLVDRLRVNYDASSSLACNSCKQRHRFDCAHNEQLLREAGFVGQEIPFLQMGPPIIEWHLDKQFFHYSRACSWDGQSEQFHTRKIAMVKRFIESVLGITN